MNVPFVQQNKKYDLQFCCFFFLVCSARRKQWKNFILQIECHQWMSWDFFFHVHFILCILIFLSLLCYIMGTVIDWANNTCLLITCVSCFCIFEGKKMKCLNILQNCCVYFFGITPCFKIKNSHFRKTLSSKVLK